MGPRVCTLTIKWPRDEFGEIAETFRRCRWCGMVAREHSQNDQCPLKTGQRFAPAGKHLQKDFVRILVGPVIGTEEELENVTLQQYEVFLHRLRSEWSNSETLVALEYMAKDGSLERREEVGVDEAIDVLEAHKLHMRLLAQLPDALQLPQNFRLSNEEPEDEKILFNLVGKKP
jgi:hypothetical protein